MAIVDTGTTYFTAEGYLFDEIMDRIPPAVCSDITDETHPPITYTLFNKAGQLRDFVFTKDMYMTEAGDGAESECSPAFMRIDIPEKHGPAMVLGEVFLRHFFAVFDRADGTPVMGQLGLAPSVHTQDALKRLHELTKQQPSFEETRGANINKYGSSFFELSRSNNNEPTANFCINHTMEGGASRCVQVCKWTQTEAWWQRRPTKTHDHWILACERTPA